LEGSLHPGQRQENNLVRANGSSAYTLLNSLVDVGNSIRSSSAGSGCHTKLPFPDMPKQLGNLDSHLIPIMSKEALIDVHLALRMTMMLMILDLEHDWNVKRFVFLCLSLALGS
jgi:hypothetical protein